MRLSSRPARYLLVGAYNTTAAYVVFVALILLLEDALHYTLILVLTWVVSTLNAFVAYRVVVFRVHGHLVRDFLRFVSVYVVALVLNLVTLPLVVSLGGLPVLDAQAILSPMTAVITYAAHKHFSFRRPTRAVVSP